VETARRPAASRWSLLLWCLAGGLLGIAVLGFDVWFLALSCLLAAVGLGLLALRWGGASGFWVALLVAGLVPSILLLWVILALPICPGPGMGLPAQVPLGTGVSCSVIPISYYLLLGAFLMLALVGLVWPLVRLLQPRLSRS
jgi:hypothetical protein